MISKTNALLFTALLLTFPALGGRSQDKPQAPEPSNAALSNGQWFNGKSFEPRAVYSVNGRFTLKKPTRVERTIDLAGTWVVPPVGEAHNHNINGMEERDRQAMQKYLADGVFYANQARGSVRAVEQVVAPPHLLPAPARAYIRSRDAKLHLRSQS
jgi:hypothetical protein